jgi:acyl carrier protein
MTTNLQQRVIKIISEVLNQNESAIRLDVSLRDDLQIDSLHQMTLFIALEDEFQLNMPPEEVTGIITVNDIVDFIDKKLQELSLT